MCKLVYIWYHKHTNTDKSANSWTVIETKKVTAGIQEITPESTFDVKKYGGNKWKAECNIRIFNSTFPAASGDDAIFPEVNTPATGVQPALLPDIPAVGVVAAGCCVESDAAFAVVFPPEPRRPFREAGVDTARRRFFIILVTSKKKNAKQMRLIENLESYLQEWQKNLTQNIIKIIIITRCLQIQKIGYISLNIPWQVLAPHAQSAK